MKELSVISFFEGSIDVILEIRENARQRQSNTFHGNGTCSVVIGASSDTMFNVGILNSCRDGLELKKTMSGEKPFTTLIQNKKKTPKTPREQKERLP